MIRLKSPHDIEKLREGGKILAFVHDAIEARISSGVTGIELDELAREEISKQGCKPAFLNYAPHGHEPYPAALCVSVNSAVVHGLPSVEPFRDGDVVGLDLGLIYQRKYYLDSARTLIVGEGSEVAKELTRVTKESLRRGIAAAQVGQRTGDIGYAIQNYVENYEAESTREGFWVVRQLVGHGVGFAVHEEPQVPNFGRPGTGTVLKPGLVIAIEPMVTAGDATVTTGADGWSVVVRSGNLSAHFEHTIAVTDKGPQILT